jgi:hypothetical protein
MACLAWSSTDPKSYNQELKPDGKARARVPPMMA